jgi:hypothetical protein
VIPNEPTPEVKEEEANSSKPSGDNEENKDEKVKVRRSMLFDRKIPIVG